MPAFNTCKYWYTVITRKKSPVMSLFHGTSEDVIARLPVELSKATVAESITSIAILILNL
jgi:hypothetical protein